MGRYRGQKFKGGYLSVPSRTPFAKNKVNIKSFKVLESLWEKGAHPQDLQKHFYFTWLVFTKGNVSRLAGLIRKHRNSVMDILAACGIKSTYNARVSLKKIVGKGWGKTIEDVVAILYGKNLRELGRNRTIRRYAAKIRARLAPPLNRIEHAALVKLWLSGFPFGGLRVHYVVWAAKKGWTLERISETLGITVRTLYRIRVGALKEEQSGHKWFSGLRKVGRKFSRPQLWLWKRGRPKMRL